MSNLTDAQLTAIADALRAGDKIAAIKLHRDATGLGLKEAKDEIEAIEADLRAKFPDRFPAKPAPSGSGCLGLLALPFAATAAGFAGWFLQTSP